MEKNTPITVPALTSLATAFLLSVTLLGGCGLPADNAADPVIDAGTASGAQSQDGSHAVSETQNGAQTDNAGQSFGGKACHKRTRLFWPPCRRLRKKRFYCSTVRIMIMTESGRPLPLPEPGRMVI